jgi:hypothetical protein
MSHRLKISISETPTPAAPVIDIGFTSYCNEDEIQEQRVQAKGEGRAKMGSKTRSSVVFVVSLRFFSGCELVLSYWF